jgi:addiction module RelE/StbE family toxin
VNIVISPEAAQDLAEIVDYLLEQNPPAAQVVLDRIRDHVFRLADMPHLGRPGRVPGTRELVVPNTPFVVPYQVVGATLEILRVYHGARRWPAEF